MVRKGKHGSLHLRQVKYFLETGNYLKSVHLAERNGIRKAAKSFMLYDGNMYYIGSEGTEKRLVLFTEEAKATAFEECHIVRKSEDHYGRTKTLQRLKEKYYWTSMVEDTVAMIVQCKPCKFNKLNKTSHYIRVTQPWEVVSFDILGQFSVSDGGQAFLIVIIDMFTKYSVAIPMRDTTVVDVATALEKSIFKLGSPQRFVSDQSEEFVRELNQVLEVDKALPKNVIAVTKTQMNRPDEASIKQQILQHCYQKESTWVDSLQQKVYEINCTFCTSSGHVPFYLMFNRRPKFLGSLSNQEAGSAKATFVVRDIEMYLAERDKKAKDLAEEVLTEHSSNPVLEETIRNKGKKRSIDDLSASTEHSSEPVLEKIMKERSIDDISLHCKQESDHGYQRVVEEAMERECKVECDTSYAFASDEPMLPDSSGSVYDMADGEGQVVVVAVGISGTEDEVELTGH